MPPDKTQAVSWYSKAAQQGSKAAATNLALMYSAGDGIPKDPAKAATWFRSAAEAGDATAQMDLAALYRRGEGVSQDDTQSILWLTKAADQRFVPAMLELASWNLQPEHGASIDAAIGWYKKAADQGDAWATSSPRNDSATSTIPKPSTGTQRQPTRGSPAENLGWERSICSGRGFRKIWKKRGVG